MSANLTTFISAYLMSNWYKPLFFRRISAWICSLACPQGSLSSTRRATKH